MIGSDLNLTLPDNSETMAENISRIATALSAIEDSIAELATPAALDITAPLDMQGNSLTDVASVQFAGGNVHNVAGSIYYYDGDWYVVDSVGTIQLTDAGQLNAASVAGIKGDYGGINPAAVTYVDSSGQYVFTDDTGDYSDLVAQSIILQGSAGTLQIGVDAALTGTRVLNFKELASAGSGFMVYDAATNSVSALATMPTPTAPDYKFTTARIAGVDGYAAYSSSHSFTSGRWVLDTTNNVITFPVQLEVGSRITLVKAYVRKLTGAGVTHQVRLFKHDLVAGTQTAVGSAGTTSAASPGYTNFETPALTQDVAAGETYQVAVNVSVGNGSGDEVLAVEVSYTRP